MSYTKDFDLIDNVRRQLQATANERDQVLLQHKRPGGGRFWPSSASIGRLETSRNCTYEVIDGACMRNSYYRMTGQSVTDFPDPRMYDIWDLGNAAEDIYVERCRNLNDYRLIFPNMNGDKLKFSGPDTGLSGEADIVIQHKETGTNIGIEMKSYYGFWGALDVAGYNAAKAAYGAGGAYLRNDDPRKTAPGKPKTQHLLQTCLYLEEFWDSPALPIKIWKIIYVARDKGPTVEFDVTLVEHEGKRCANVDGVFYPDINLEAIHARYAALGQYVDSGELPPRDFVIEYDPNYIMTGNLPMDMSMWHKVKHMDWKDTVNKKVNSARSAANKKKYLSEAQTVTKRDWNCDYCPYLSRCQQDEGDDGVI